MTDSLIHGMGTAGMESLGGERSGEMPDVRERKVRSWKQKLGCVGSGLRAAVGASGMCGREDVGGGDR